MKKLLVIFLCLFLTERALTQSVLDLKLTPLNIFDPGAPVIPIGFEYRFKKFGVEFDHGFRTKSFVFYWNEDKISRKYFRSRLGFRYYFEESNFANQFFLLSISHLPQKYRKEDTWYYKNRIEYRFDRANIKYTNTKAYIAYGAKINVSKKFRTELIGGFGVGYRVFTYNTIGETESIDPVFREWEFAQGDRDEGQYWCPSLLFNVRFCYRLF